MIATRAEVADESPPAALGLRCATCAVRARCGAARTALADAPGCPVAAELGRAIEEEEVASGRLLSIAMAAGMADGGLAVIIAEARERYQLRMAGFRLVLAMASGAR